MLLAIDAGNTNIVFAIFDGESLRGQWRAASRSDRTSDEFAVWLDQLMGLEGLKRADVDTAIIASVVPAVLFALRTLCRKYFECDPMIVGEPGVDLGIGIHVDRPDEVGADRLVNAVAAHESYHGPLVVVDFGTATTFDVVEGDGSYAGGVIAPGVNLSLEALHQAAAKLPRVAVRRPEHVIGKSTIGAMEAGIYWGYVGLIEGILGRINAEAGRDLKVIATGGLAPLFARAISAVETVDGDLTLRGLQVIHARNSTPGTPAAA